MGKKKIISVFCLILILQCLVIVMWGTQKVRLNVDEMFTMEGVRQCGYGMRYWDTAEDFYGKEHTHQEFQDYMTVTEGDLLFFQGLPTVYDALMHRDLYYSMVNLAATINLGHIPWSVGVGLNLLFFVIAQILLYWIAKKVLGEARALAVIAAFGFSAGAISTVLYVRCYMMLVMLTLLLVCLYLKFMSAGKSWQKLCCIAGIELLAVLCYRTHQFGAILFAIITALFICYMIGSRRKKSLIWLAIGYGIPFLLGIGIILPKLKAFFGSGVAALFYDIARNMSKAQLAAYILQIVCTVAQHLFVRITIMLLIVAAMFVLYGRTVYMRRKNVVSEKAVYDDAGYEGVDRQSEKSDLEWPVVVIAAITLAIYYGILAVGSAVSWKYLSPGYPFIVLIFVSMVVWLGRTMGGPLRVKALMITAGVAMTLASYDTQHISELFAEEEGMQEALETQYHGVNGVMIHHDVQGDGEVYLYEAAALWPEESNVLVLQHHMLLESGLFECRDDDKILLWLTADFDREESIDLFKNCTDYRDIRLILNTDHVWVYECNKYMQ